MGFLQTFDELFSTGDPTVRTWFLVRESYLPFLLCTLYVIFCTTVGPALMRDRKPWDLRLSMIIFNFGVVLVYISALYVAFINLSKVTWHVFCFGAPSSDVVVKGRPEYSLALAAYTAYVIKYVEFLDTVFFVLRKKNNQITKLHIIHHTVVPIAGWIMIRTEKSGLQAVPGIINACVHVIMYTYYGLSAIGPSVQKHLWWKKYVTQLQMIQFILIILLVLLVAPLSGCTMVLSSYIADIVLATLFFYLFYQYYLSTFKSPARKEQARQISGCKASAQENTNCKLPARK